jgi:hypothetical protein
MLPSGTCCTVKPYFLFSFFSLESGSFDFAWLAVYSDGFTLVLSP